MKPVFQIPAKQALLRRSVRCATAGNGPPGAPAVLFRCAQAPFRCFVVRVRQRR